MRYGKIVIGTVAATMGLLASCSSTGAQSLGAPSTAHESKTQATPSSSESAVSAESPVAPESNPPGDIPDNTVFVPYRSSTGGLTISVPEAWARTTIKGSFSFTDKLNTVAVAWEPVAKGPTVSSARATEVPQLRRTTRAFQLQGVSTASLRAGPAVFLRYQINSDPNRVTGKQYRMDVQRYDLFHNGNEVIVTLTSPVGADNVDPWRIITQSVKWS
ncbi:MAG: hypothetical protein M3P43_03975 [Actinomycetota bacterium]|nr:hypothetical protein [Actinomycetota bacterium]